jgi:hypothetical protein
LQPARASVQAMAKTYPGFAFIICVPYRIPARHGGTAGKRRPDCTSCPCCLVDRASLASGSARVNP